MAVELQLFGIGVLLAFNDSFVLLQHFNLLPHDVINQGFELTRHLLNLSLMLRPPSPKLLQDQLPLVILRILQHLLWLRLGPYLRRLPLYLLFLIETPPSILLLQLIQIIVNRSVDRIAIPRHSTRAPSLLVGCDIGVFIPRDTLFTVHRVLMVVLGGVAVAALLSALVHTAGRDGDGWCGWGRRWGGDYGGRV